jgi:hypothetical protein
VVLNYWYSSRTPWLLKKRLLLQEDLKANPNFAWKVLPVKSLENLNQNFQSKNQTDSNLPLLPPSLLDLVHHVQLAHHQLEPNPGTLILSVDPTLLHLRPLLALKPERSLVVGPQSLILKLGVTLC